MEQVLVEPAYRRRETKQARGVCGGFQVKFYAHQLALPEADVAVNFGAVRRIHLYTHGVEDAKGGKAIIADICQFFAVQVAGLDYVNVSQHVFAERHARRMRDVHFPYMVFDQGRGVAFRLVSGVFPYLVGEYVPGPQGVGLEEVIELAEKELLTVSNKIVQKDLMSKQEIEKSQNSWRKYRDDYCGAEMFLYQEKSFCEMRLTVDRLSELNRISEYTQ